MKPDETPDLFGDVPEPRVELKTQGDVAGVAIEYAKAICDGTFRGSFNSYRDHRRIAVLPQWSGAVVSSICRQKGLSIIGVDRAQASASKGRLCAIWGKV